jgi:hypothetical protein
MEQEVELTCGVVVVVERIPATDWYLFEQAHEKPPPPKREAKAIGGVTELLDDEENPEYVALCEELDREESADLHEFILDHVRLRDEVPEEVKVKLRKWGIEPTERNVILHFMGEYHAQDFAILQYTARRMSRVTNEEVRIALDRFRDKMGWTTAADGDGDTEESLSDKE